MISATVLVGAGGAITGVLTNALVSIQPGIFNRFSGYLQFDSVVLSTNLLYISLSAPFLLCIFTIGGTFAAGFSSRFTGFDDQEWWGRCGAWILITGLAWSGICLFSSFGPLFVVGPRRH